MLTLASCTVSKALYMETYSPEESGLNLVKITEAENNSVVTGTPIRVDPYTDYSTRTQGYSRNQRFAWNVHQTLDVSPDGSKLAYCTKMNNAVNIMVRNASSQGTSTQRTFRNVHSFSWGDDGKLYFSDINGGSDYICSVDAQAGSLMNQLTTGTVIDILPVLSADKKLVYFTRQSSSGPSIWSLNRDNGTLTSCARGYAPCLIPGNPNAFYCVRNSAEGRSEIWYVDFVKGQESLVLSDENRSFTNPRLSPDGQWIACVGNAVSSINQENNLDIFVVRTDGSRLTQLTFHPETDTCPAWAADGRSIYFISSRANEKQAFNVWRMNFNLE